VTSIRRVLRGTDARNKRGVARGDSRNPFLLDRPQRKTAIGNPKFEGVEGRPVNNGVARKGARKIQDSAEYSGIKGGVSGRLETRIEPEEGTAIRPKRSRR